MQLAKVITVLLALMLAMQASKGEERTEEVTSVSRSIVQNQVWLDDAKKCPADVMRDVETWDSLHPNGCKAGSLAQCLSKCKSGDPSSCYWLGYALQQGHADPMASETVYQRACKLGIVSGCTNRAAGQTVDNLKEKQTLACAARTYKTACALDDPWACTMYALHLSRGLGIPENKELALKVLEKSCTYGPDDPACGYGMRIKTDLQNGANAASEKE